MMLHISLFNLPNSCTSFPLLDQGPSGYEPGNPIFCFIRFAGQEVTVVEVPETVRQVRGRCVTAVVQKGLEIREKLIEVSHLCNRCPVHSQRTLTE